jgi:tRNA pseudouridine55 synthase
MLPFRKELDTVDFMEGGLLLVNKPGGWTSFDVVNRIRHLLQKKYQKKNIKVGHSGTLDPMATGLLLVATGKWTKELHTLQGADKVYQASVTLGIETDTYDGEGVVVARKDVPPLTPLQILEVLQSFQGVMNQMPPAYSAIKKDGKKLYELAREGKTVEVEPRKVTVFEIQLLEFVIPKINLLVHSGSGFYVRSLAHDIGEKLGCGAHLSALMRTAVGQYRLDDALTMPEIVSFFQKTA